MDPGLGRDDYQENIMAGFIRGDEVIVGDVTKQFLNDSGEGDESLSRGGRCFGEVDTDASGEGGLGGSDDGEDDEQEVKEREVDGSGEVYIYM